MIRFKLLCLLFLAALGGCQKDPADISGDNLVKLTLSLDTYAGSDNNASTNETELESVYIYIFNEAGVLENVRDTKVASSSGSLVDSDGNLNKSWQVTRGAKTIYALVNPGQLSLSDGSVPAYDTYNFTEELLLQLRLRDNAIQTDFTGSKPMLMTGKRTVTLTGSETVELTVTRPYSRIDLRVRASADNVLLRTLKSATLCNRNTMWTAFSLTDGASTVDPHFDAVEFSAGSGNITATELKACGSIYTMPQPFGSSTWNPAASNISDYKCCSVKLTLEDSNGRSFDLYAYINEDAINGGKGNNADKPLSIGSNHLIKLDVTVTNKALDVQLFITDWFDQAIDGDIPGNTLDAEPYVFLALGNTTSVVVNSNAEQVQAKLSADALSAGYSLSGAGSNGVLTLTPDADGNVAIPVAVPASPSVGSGGYPELMVVAGNIRRDVMLNPETVFDVESVSSSVDYMGGPLNFEVKSWVVLSNGNLPLPWKVDGYQVDGATEWSATAPAWLTGLPASSLGSTTPESISATVAAQTEQMLNSQNDKLKATAPVSNYNLSTVGGTTAMNTANCYLVNAPGTYRLPLVYGNAIKNGATNTSAYISTAPAGETILSRFLNNLGAGITNPYIYNNANCTPDDCCLVWQDAEGLVSDVKLSADKKYLEFSVPQASICQGNAVVAVRNASKQIMWSWHIWVTDYKLGDGLQRTTNYEGYTNDFLPVNIGWCDPGTLIYPSRSVSVRFTQTASGIVRSLSLQQSYSSAAISGNSPYFQWGRKDPMLPGLVGGVNGVDKSVYNGSDYTWGIASLQDSISNYIQRPHLFNSDKFMDNKYENLWSANYIANTNNDNVVVKTVYDPSPVGFSMPPWKAWTGFTTTGKNTNTASEIRGTWTTSVSPAGCNFNLTSGGTAYYPALGYRTFYNTAMFHLDRGGYYWSAVPYSARVGYHFDFYHASLYPTSYLFRSYGFSVRSVKEQL